MSRRPVRDRAWYRRVATRAAEMRRDRGETLSDSDKAWLGLLPPNHGPVLVTICMADLAAAMDEEERGCRTLQ